MWRPRPDPRGITLVILLRFQEESACKPFRFDGRKTSTLAQVLHFGLRHLAEQLRPSVQSGKQARPGNPPMAEIHGTPPAIALLSLRFPSSSGSGTMEHSHFRMWRFSAQAVPLVGPEGSLRESRVVCRLRGVARQWRAGPSPRGGAPPRGHGVGASRED